MKCSREKLTLNTTGLAKFCTEDLFCANFWYSAIHKNISIKDRINNNWNRNNPSALQTYEQLNLTN